MQPRLEIKPIPLYLAAMSIDNRHKLENLLKQGIVIGDGAIGTQLQILAGRTIACPEALALESGGREILRRVHSAYLEAGARLIETNTFAANPLRLETLGLADRCEQIIAQTVAVAREVAPPDALVAGSVGPLDLGLAAKDMPADVMAAVYRRQISALADGGVNALMLETFSSVVEARSALTVAVQTGLPVLFAVGGQSLARTYARNTVMELIALADEFKVDGVGFNCLAPYDLSQLLPILLQRTDRPIMAYPNAGTPAVVRGLVRYDLPDSILLAEARAWCDQGVAILGGCCGTGPGHIRALAQAFVGHPVSRSLKSSSAPRVSLVNRPASTSSAPPKTLAVNPIRQKIASGRRPLVAVEIKPSINQALRETAAGLRAIVEAGPDFFDVPDNAGANPGRDCVACAAIIQEMYNLPVIIHKTATQTNALHLHSYLLGAYDLGVRGVLALTGDPPHVGAFDRLSSRVGDIRNSVELLRLLALLRSGMLSNGQPLPGAVDFASGCAFAPSQSMKPQVQWLKKKIEAGAEFAFTQPLFAVEDYNRMRAELAEINLPIFVGILPLVSARQAEFLGSGKIPGIIVPKGVAEAICRYPAAEDQARAGLELTRGLIERLSVSAHGIYIIMPFHKKAVNWTADLVRHVVGCRKPVS